MFTGFGDHENLHMGISCWGLKPALACKGGAYKLDQLFKKFEKAAFVFLLCKQTALTRNPTQPPLKAYQNNGAWLIFIFFLRASAFYFPE